MSRNKLAFNMTQLKMTQLKLNVLQPIFQADKDPVPVRYDGLPPAGVLRMGLYIAFSTPSFPLCRESCLDSRGLYPSPVRHALRYMTRSLAWTGLCWLSLTGLINAQQTERAYSSPSAPNYSNANLPAQPVGPNDLLALSVYDSPELTRTVRVSGSGDIRLPMLKDPIKVAGMVPSEVESAIATSLEKGNVLVDPIVTVTIVEYQSRPVNVVGAVKNPLVFQATQPIPLLDAIARAGGLREDAGSDILVSQEVAGGGKPEWVTRTIPVRALIDQADSKLNVMLHGGEEVLVPEARKIYVVGNVKKPGAFPVRNDEETTVLQVLALSEGLAPYAAKEAYVYRRSPAGTKTEIPVALGQIMKRKSPDVPLKANDILYIPDEKGKRLTAQTLDRIAGIGGQAAVGYAIYH